MAFQVNLATQAAPSSISTALLQNGAVVVDKINIDKNISFNNHKLTSLLDPTPGSQEAATAIYVDNAISAVVSGLQPKASVLVATTAALTYTEAGGVLSVTGLTDGKIDAVAISDGSRILVKDEAGANEKFNGIYVASAVNAGAGTATLTRSSDANNVPKVSDGMYCWVDQGTTNQTTAWILTSDNPITLGTTALTFVKYAVYAPTTISTGVGLANNVGTISVKVDTVTDAINTNILKATTDGVRVVVDPNEFSADVTGLHIKSASIAATKLANITDANCVLLSDNGTDAGKLVKVRRNIPYRAANGTFEAIVGATTFTEYTFTSRDAIDPTQVIVFRDGMMVDPQEYTAANVSGQLKVTFGASQTTDNVIGADFYYHVA